MIFNMAVLLVLLIYHVLEWGEQARNEGVSMRHLLLRLFSIEARHQRAGATPLEPQVHNSWLFQEEQPPRTLMHHQKWKIPHFKDILIIHLIISEFLSTNLYF